ncbi:MAG TPA: hypothetical protein PKB10_09250 [Tepidisphaeraceae bacterium]|nr:hypothetical protein [Tepidisphaeraceae bacterium]
MGLIEYALWVIGALVVICAIGLPLMILFTWSFPAQMSPQFVTLGSGMEEAAGYFRSIERSLADEGFKATRPILPPGMGTAVGVMILLVNRRTGDAAAAAAIFARDGKGGMVLKQKYLEFMTLFDNGHAILTGNSSELSAFAPVPERDSIMLPGVTSPSLLHRLHTQRVQLSPHARQQRVIPQPGEEAKFAVEEVIAAIDAQTRTGYMRRSGNVYRPTIKGAFLMVWKNLPPFSWIRKSLSNARARAEAARLNADPASVV